MIVDAWFDARNRLLASPRFQRSASDLPLIRRSAQHHARALFDLCAGFVYSQILLACVQLDVFERLAAGPRELQALAAELALPLEAAERLVGAAVALGLLERRRNGRVGLGVLGAALRANPGVLAMIEHHRLLYADLADPVALLRAPRGATGLARYWAYAGTTPQQPPAADAVRDYTRLMSASQQLVADVVLDAYPLESHRCLLDVGGGDGTFLERAARRAPALRLMLMDLPRVVALSRARLDAAGLGARATLLGGDFRRDALPRGADVITLVRVLHDHDDAAAAALLAAVHTALDDGGSVLVAEPFAATSGAETVGDAYFGMYLWAMGQGRTRRREELLALLQAAGFVAARSMRTRAPLQTGLIVARKRAGRRGAQATRGEAAARAGTKCKLNLTTQRVSVA